MVKTGLGSAALKNETDFATPAAVTAANAASQQRDDAINERVDNVEFSITTIANGADASFNTYAEMIAYTPSKANVSVRVNADPDATKTVLIRGMGVRIIRVSILVNIFLILSVLMRRLNLKSYQILQTSI